MPGTTSQIQTLLILLRSGVNVGDQLIEHSLSRLRALSARMFRRYQSLRSQADTDDVLQLGIVRLLKSLRQISPESPPAFFGLAATHIRWVLCDLARELSRRKEWVLSQGPPSDSTMNPEAPVAPNGDPTSLLEWADFHQAVEQLPAEEREVFDVLFYQGLTQEEAAEVLKLSLRTLKRRWQRARLLLSSSLHGQMPPLP